MALQPTRFLQAREGEDLFLTERITRPDGTLHVPGDFGGVNPVRLRVYDRTANSPTIPVYAPADSAIAGVVIDPALTDGLWEGRDSRGYNFVFRIKPGDFRFLGGKIYDVEFALTGTFAGSAIVKTVVFQVSVTPTMLVV